MKSFILRPTRLGFYLIGLNFILFILSIGYSNNLLFLFSLVLIAQTLFWYVETLNFDHKSIRDLKISSHFLGENTYASFSAESERCQRISVVINGKKYQVKETSFLNSSMIFSLFLKERGKYTLNTISFYDSRPFSLFARKIKLAPQNIFYVYPRFNPLISLNLSEESQEESGINQSDKRGEEDFLELRPYQGEDFKKINWKYFARSEEIYIKQGLYPQLPYLDFKVSQGVEESELSSIASQMVLAQRNNYPFSLKINDTFIAHDTSLAHLARCLERLSEC